VALLVLLLGSFDQFLGLLMASAYLAPPALVCSLLAILLVRSHLNGWNLLVGVLTLPWNVGTTMILCGLTLFPCSC
jgi:hypothetical protein